MVDFVFIRVRLCVATPGLGAAVASTSTVTGNSGTCCPTVPLNSLLAGCFSGGKGILELALNLLLEFVFVFPELLYVALAVL